RCRPPSWWPLNDQRPEVVAREQKPALHDLELALEAAVLVLDRDNPVVADRVQRAQEAVPTHLAEAGQARYLPAHAERQHSLVVEPVAIDLHVFRVYVEDARGELADRACVIDELPHQV